MILTIKHPKFFPSITTNCATLQLSLIAPSSAGHLQTCLINRLFPASTAATALLRGRTLTADLQTTTPTESAFCTTRPTLMPGWKLSFQRLNRHFAPTPRALAEYLAQQDVYEDKGLMDCRLALTEGAPDVAEATMSMSLAKKCTSIDAAYKFSSHIRVYDEATGKNNTTDESHEHIGPTLDKNLANADREGWTPTADHPIMLITDNVHNVKGLVKQKNPHIEVKQDPWHLMNRILSKISDKPERARVAGALKAALYIESKDLRPPEEAAVAFEIACRSVDCNNSISAASLEKWNGTVGRKRLADSGWLCSVFG
ncbi:hypothetical protein DFS34DRAFT_652808 [Phlyctochytrium arcticum]|nr:hypothetical protein DFS34DRAFT_652808 [Phlyctochytrium arcticum]